MSSFYEAVGRLVVGSLRQRYGTQLLAVAGGLLLVALGALLMGVRASRRSRAQ